MLEIDVAIVVTENKMHDPKSLEVFKLVADAKQQTTVLRDLTQILKSI